MREGGQIRVGFLEAVECLIGLLEEMQPTPGRRHTIGITGPVGSGKSTLAAGLAVRGGLVVSTDNYLPDYERVPFQERDEPRHADLSLLATHVAELRLGREVEIPKWSFQSHRRESSQVMGPVSPDNAVIVEGIHALHAPVRSHLDIAVYVDAAPEVRWRRWERLELSGERGWGVEHARDHFERVAEPAFARHAAAYRAAADVLVQND
jgi:uridine kinase